VFFEKWAWKLAAAPTVTEVLFIKTSFNLALQTGLVFAVITYQATSTGILISLTADAVDSAWSQQF